MPMYPRGGQAAWIRQRKSCAFSSGEGVLKDVTVQPWGLTPLMTCRMVPSLPLGIDPL